MIRAYSVGFQSSGIIRLAGALVKSAFMSASGYPASPQPTLVNRKRVLGCSAHLEYSLSRDAWSDDMGNCSNFFPSVGNAYAIPVKPSPTPFFAPNCFLAWRAAPAP